MIKQGYALFKGLILVLLLLLSDIIGICFSFLLGYYLRAWFFVDIIHFFSPIRHGLDIYMSMWPILSLWLLMFAYGGLYPSIGISFWEEIKGILKGNLIAFVIVVLLTFITRTSVQFSRPVIFLAFILSIVFLPVMRRIARSLLRRTGLWSKDVVLIGTEKAINQVLCNLRKHPDWGFNPVGVLLPHGAGDPGDIKVLGAIEHMETVSIASDEVIVAMPELSREKLVEVVERAAKIAPVVKVLPDLYGLASVGVRTHDLDGMLLLEMEDRLARVQNRAIKRSFDIVLSLFGLVVFSPVLFILAVVIKIDSKGSVFFGHTRVGKRGKTFTCYKFRTMVENAKETLEELLANDPEARAQWDKDFKLKEDPRVTKMGVFLRKTSFDELPQLWNVFKGDMSLVGPRPIVSDEVEKYGEKARYFFKVTPGITGLWQVSGRNDIDYDERVLLDEYYAKNWSLWLDIEIIIRTFGAVLKSEGAY
ncbi:MAG: undecaprenyl-phosphate galactose phosphotransferase WbaP [Thermodesulfobacteriota bacterium]|nr:undecaprenyl-phosphate galactose phosphotransferase WbaP [Thermodesulfobacteriota bacterium]